MRQLGDVGHLERKGINNDIEEGEGLNISVNRMKELGGGLDGIVTYT